MNKPATTGTAPLLLSIMTIITLLAPFSMAQAQSMEYRRGYDDGYSAGMDAARSGQMGGPGVMQPGGARQRIIIEDAMYGDQEGVCDARAVVQAMVDRQREPLVRVDNRLCGDPSPHRGKTLEIIYRCGNGRMLRTALRENSQAVLTCRN